MFPAILAMHLPVPQAFPLLLRLGGIGGMHEGWAADAVVDRSSVKEKCTAFPHGTNMEIGIFHQPDGWVKAT